jgi:hypothetical protein
MGVKAGLRIAYSNQKFIGQAPTGLEQMPKPGHD